MLSFAVCHIEKFFSLRCSDLQMGLKEKIFQLAELVLSMIDLHNKKEHVVICLRNIT